MYDIEIMAPIETNEEILAKRIKDFKKWGIQNIRDKKTKLLLVASNDNNIEKIKENFENYDLEVIQSPYKHVTQKIFHYYTEIINPNNARWFMRVDDDSLTDINFLIDSLDKNFDHTRDYYITGELHHHVQEVEMKIVKALGFEWWYPGFDYEDDPAHENELCVASQSTVRRILQNEKSMKLLKTRMEFAEGAGDHCYCLAARMVKIFPTMVKFITHYNKIINFSAYHGKFAHIHEVSHDKSPEVMSWLHLYEDKSIEDMKPFFNSSFVLKEPFINFTESGKQIIDFNEKGQIWMEGEKIGIWAVNKNKDIIALIKTEDVENRECFIFKKENNKFVSKNGYEIIKV
jgi:hypothetical protein